MASVNKVILLGNVGKDPETRYMPNGDAVSNCSIATSKTWKDKATGEKKEKTTWHRLIFWRKLGEIVEQYVTKGMSIYVEGELEQRKYEKDGQEHYVTEINCSVMQMVGGRREGGDSEERGGNEGYSRTPDRQAAPERQAAPAKKRPPTSFDDMDDDIPF